MHLVECGDVECKDLDGVGVGVEGNGGDRFKRFGIGEKGDKALHDGLWWGCVDGVLVYLVHGIAPD